MLPLQSLDTKLRRLFVLRCEEELIFLAAST